MIQTRHFQLINGVGCDWGVIVMHLYVDHIWQNRQVWGSFFGRIHTFTSIMFRGSAPGAKSQFAHSCKVVPWQPDISIP
jgi:hypothetical protein